jgi:glycylpeptide N-tetradecanoyltransferase
MDLLDSSTGDGGGGARGGSSNNKSSRTAFDPMTATTKQQYQFWDTQPVPKIGEAVTECTAIEPSVPTSEIRHEPYSLPAGFSWDTLDMDDEAQLKELYQLLNENYVEDDDNMFRFDYSPEFLRW